MAADLGARITLIVDGGATPVGLESTIVKVEGEGLRLLRPGGVAAEDIEAVAGVKLLRGAAAGIEAPGMLASHYAPGAAVRLNAGRGRRRRSAARLRQTPRRRLAGCRRPAAICRESGDLREAATNLFAYLQALDQSGATTIAVEPIPFDGLGEAINDRLCRAAAPRDKAD